jgi:glucose/arabinose dehydrogenase
MHPFAIDARGNMYVDLGSATNSCQVKNRTLESPGINPCTELETRAGTWRYDANRTGQRFSPAERFITGLRNGEGFAFGPSGEIYATMHGRDQLSENWPKLYRPEQGPNLPAEELVRLEQGADYGWPECYFDGPQQKLVLAPERSSTAYPTPRTTGAQCRPRVARSSPIPMSVRWPPMYGPWVTRRRVDPSSTVSKGQRRKITRRETLRRRGLYRA